MNTTPMNGGPYQATLIELCGAYEAMAADLENRVRSLRQNDEIVRGVPGEPYDTGECVANIVLAVRHLEDARLGLGKAIKVRSYGSSAVLGQQVGRHLRRDTAEYKQQEKARQAAQEEQVDPNRMNVPDEDVAVESVTGEGGSDFLVKQFHQVEAELKSAQLQERLADRVHDRIDGAVTTPCGHCNGGAL